MRGSQLCQKNPILVDNNWSVENRIYAPEYVEEKEDVSSNADQSWQVGQPLHPPEENSFKLETFFEIYQAADGCAQHCPSPACNLQKDKIKWDHKALDTGLPKNAHLLYGHDRKLGSEIAPNLAFRYFT